MNRNRDSFTFEWFQRAFRSKVSVSVNTFLQIANRKLHFRLRNDDEARIDQSCTGIQTEWVGEKKKMERERERENKWLADKTTKSTRTTELQAHFLYKKFQIVNWWWMMKMVKIEKTRSSSGLVWFRVISSWSCRPLSLAVRYAKLQRK